MPYYITTQMPVAAIDALKAAINAQIAAMAPYKVSLNTDQKTGARTMAAGREGLARMISQIALAHVNSLARELNPADLAARLAYDAKLEEGRQALMKALETIAETQLANGIDAMVMVDAYAANLQISRKNIAALDLAMQEVDEWNARFAHKEPEA